MEWWSFFRTVRRVGFSLVSVVALLWAILLSVYLAREWKHAIHSQRLIVLLMIGFNAFSSVLLYLMVVVVFRLWLDFLRTLSLFAMHLGTAIPLSILRSRFDCSVFVSQRTCSSAYTFALFVNWSVVAFFVLHAVFLCVMSRFPAPPPPPSSSTDDLIPSTEKALGDLEKNEEPTSPDSVVSQAERVQIAAARLVIVDGVPRPVPAPRTPWQFQRSATVSSDTLDSLPTLPYGASSLDGFMKPSPSPAPSYTSLDDARPPFGQLPSRRMRSLRLDRFALDPLARQGSPESLLSVSTVESGSSAYSHMADTKQLARPPQAVVADHRKTPSSRSLTIDVPAQLRPGTPASLHRSDSASSVGSDSIAVSHCDAHHPSRMHVATPNSIHSFAPSLLFMDGNESRAATPIPTHSRSASDPPVRPISTGLSRQPTKVLRLPNPYDLPPVDSPRWGRPQRSTSLGSSVSPTS